MRNVPPAPLDERTSFEHDTGNERRTRERKVCLPVHIRPIPLPPADRRYYNYAGSKPARTLLHHFAGSLPRGDVPVSYISLFVFDIGVYGIPG